MFQRPTNCPSCDSTLEIKNGILYCVNNTCSAKQNKAVEHFSKTLKIKGLGPATIEKLGLTSVSEIYIIDPASKITSERVAEKLINEINNSKSHKLNKVLPALGIPLIGNSATAKLSTVCKSIFDINSETCAKAGLGPKATNNLIDWLTLNLDWVLELPFDFLFEESNNRATKGVVCITGRLSSYKSKSEASKDLEAFGWKVVGSVTKEVTHLVNESGKSTAKTEKAAASGIKIVENVAQLLQGE